MKNLKIRPGTIEIKELTDKVQKHFGLEYRVTDNGKNEIIIAKNKTIGCRVILSNKRLMISGTFPTPVSVILAMIIFVVGMIVIPMAIYMVAFKGKFAAIEKEVHSYVLAEFPDRLL